MRPTAGKRSNRNRQSRRANRPASGIAAFSFSRARRLTRPSEIEEIASLLVLVMHPAIELVGRARAIAVVQIRDQCTGSVVQAAVEKLVSCRRCRRSRRALHTRCDSRNFQRGCSLSASTGASASRKIASACVERDPYSADDMGPVTPQLIVQTPASSRYETRRSCSSDFRKLQCRIRMSCTTRLRKNEGCGGAPASFPRAAALGDRLVHIELCRERS
jgi:hypothetical protein